MTDDSALQADSGVEVVTTADTPEVSVTPEVEAPLASASESEHEANTEPESEADKAQKAINKQTWKFREEERKSQALQAELDELRAKQLPADVAPEIPPIPDALELSDEEFREQISKRDEALRQNAAHSERQQFQAQESQRLEQAQLEQQQKSVDKIRQDYTDKAVNLGLEPDKVLTATAEIVNFGVSDAVAEMIATEADGPLMAMYLRQNPVELQSLQSMPVYQQIDRMKSAVRDGANTLKPKASNAPAPPTDVRGGGSATEADPLLDGLTLNI